MSEEPTTGSGNKETPSLPMGGSRPHRYRLYVDESGDHTLGQVNEGSHRYLGLMGVWFRQAVEYVDFADALEKFKRSIFGARPDKPVVLHRSAIINRKGAFGLLCEPSLRDRFDKELLEVIHQARFHMVCVVIDKRTHGEKYDSPFHPYHYCLAAMLDRYSGWLNFKNAVGDVMAESRGREEDLQLKQAYRRVYESGTLMFSRQHHQKALTSRDLKVQSKRANVAGLQLADILAYPIKQSMLVESGDVADPGDVFGKRVLEMAASRFNRQEHSGQVEGYGKVWLK